MRLNTIILKYANIKNIFDQEFNLARIKTHDQLFFDFKIFLLATQMTHMACGIHSNVICQNRLSSDYVNFRRHSKHL